MNTDIYFYQLKGYSNPNVWFCNWNGVAINEWCFEHGVKYKIEYFDGFKIGIILFEDKDKVYFQLRWGDTPRKFEDYID